MGLTAMDDGEATAAGTPATQATAQDLYLPWAERTQIPTAHRQSTRSTARFGIWLLLEIKPSIADFAKVCEATLGTDCCVRLPNHYESGASYLDDATFCTALVDEKFLSGLTGHHGLAAPAADVAARIVRFEVGYRMNAWEDGLGSSPVDATKAKAEAGAEAGVDAPSAVVGIVDDGLAFANARFCRDNDGCRTTRFLSFWDQDADPGCWNRGRYGRTHSMNDLNGYISGACSSGRIDEDRAYAAARYTAARRRVRHGTHVLDLACGEEPNVSSGVAIVGVQVPGRVLEDTSCASATVFLLDGIRHILAEADRVGGGGCPAVINLSMGNIAGPHNGSSIFERALDELIELRCEKAASLRIVLPVGNSYLSKCHANFKVYKDKARQLRWKVCAGDTTPSFIELWFSKKGVEPLDIDGIELTVTRLGFRPSGERSTRIRSSG